MLDIMAVYDKERHGGLTHNVACAGAILLLGSVRLTMELTVASLYPVLSTAACWASFVPLPMPPRATELL